MDFESKAATPTATDNVKFTQSTSVRKPLELLRDTEALLRQPTVATLTPVLPPKLSKKLQVASNLADDTLKELAEIDLEQINDLELRHSRIRVGLSFVGFGALMMLILLLYANTLHPELSTIGQVRQYWYQYILCVSLGIAGMFLLGREAMRPIAKQKKFKKW